MLTFFRHIRRSLLGEGATSKYLLYAIGEITLVVIGILIALQINNWNENQRTEEQVQLYLLNLSEAIMEDIEKHKRAASQNEFRYHAFQYLLKITGNEQLEEVRPLPKDELNNGIWPDAYPDTFNREFIELCFGTSVFHQTQNTNQAVYDEMKSTGLFSQINNQALKKSIQEYYNFCLTYLTESGDWNLRISTSWQSFLRDNYDFVITGTQPFGDPVELLDDSPVIVRIQELTSPARFRSMNSYRAISLGENLMSEIEKELNKPQ
jgi:hypothetical protein